MHKSTLVAAALCAFSAVQSMPVDVVDEAPTPVAALPDGVMRNIIDRLPLKNRVQAGAVSVNLKDYANPENIAEYVRGIAGDQAFKTAFDSGIDDMKVYDALLKTLGPHDGNHDYAARVAARNGNIKKLKEYKAAYHRMPESALVGAAESADMEAFMHAYHNGAYHRNALEDVSTAAGANGQTEFLRWLLHEPFFRPEVWQSFWTNAVEAAARHGHDETVDMMHSEAGSKRPYDDWVEQSAIVGAAGGAHWDLFQKYARINLTPITVDKAYLAAAASGNLPFMRFLDDNGAKTSRLNDALAITVQHDRREAFDYIRDRYPQWPASTSPAYRHALEEGREYYRQVLEPRAQQVDPLGALLDARDAAITRGDAAHLGVVLDELTNRHNFHEYRYHDYSEAARNGHWNVIERLAAHRGASLRTVNMVLTEAMEKGNVDLVVRVLQSGIGGVMPNVGLARHERHPTLAIAKARLLILAKHQDFRDQFFRMVTPATKLVYADALSDAIAIAQEEEFTADEIEFLEGLERELQQ